MNIETARTIALSEILQKIGLTLVKKRSSGEWYYSPFRQERTPSFKVNTVLNTWYDFGEGLGGDPIDFVCHYLNSSDTGNSISDALRWLGNMFPADHSVCIYPTWESKSEENILILKSVKPLTHVALIRYLESRGILKEVAVKYLREVRIYNQRTGKEYFAAAIKNEEDGYDYRNLYFKGCVKKKAISFIRGTVVGTNGIHIFEGFMDFLSTITKKNGIMFEEDVMILNSISLLKDATAYIRGFGYQTAFTWLDNDDPGHKATKAFGAFFHSEHILHVPMNHQYAHGKDVNEAHMLSMGLKIGS
ncbi:hypothetical protein BLX24_29565 [Arsenicibacter rosenii]|uniref:Zinc finger CHC2-type domain-containing protein n=2 Tax=Arsenicibacter rosenii TaxID=1750698 RepID=A0A1S2VA12_9BACT|nr:hypothetical protein BLX24_29565 [Arsenicibacter rosenii]